MQTSKQASPVNEPVMNNIKKRLKDAYDNVKFYASKTWTNDHHLYQKANQELYARHIKIQETFAEDLTRARTVQDSIPQSKLAQYSNYEYDEARELSYTPSGGDVIFHYPCRQKKEAITEPWMLPEVEQLFIWLTYSGDFNLLRYRDLVEFEPAETSKQTCTLKDFHKVDPRFYETFERTPGKPRFTKSDCITDVDLQQFVPPLLNLNTFEDMTVKMKIDLDIIKNIWKTSRTDDSEEILPKKFQVFKSSFDNLFVNDNSRSAECLQHPDYFNLNNVPYHFNELQERANDFRNLQNLAELLKKLKKESKAVATVKRPHVTNSKSETDTKVMTPTRRLYSDVVQGLVSSKNSSPKIPVPSSSSTTLGQTSSFNEDSPKADETCSLKFASVVRNRPPTPPASWLEQSWAGKPEKKSVDHTYASQAKYGKSFLNNAASYSDTSFSSHNCNATFVNSNSYQTYFGGGNVIPNDGYHPNDVYGTYVNNTAQNPNIYGGGFCPNAPYQYPQNNVYCNSFANANFPSNAYAPYVVPTNARTFMQQKQNAVHFNNSGQQWIMHQYRTPSIYNVAHFPPQPYFLLPPQPPKQQRWMQAPHYVRPPVPQTYHHVGITPPHTPPPQNWGVQNQNLYKTNSTQHVCTPAPQHHHHHQVFENSSSVDLRQKYKHKKINSQVNLRRNRSPENPPECVSKFKTKPPAAFKKSCDVTSGKTLVKPSSTDSIDFKYVIKSKESLNVEQKSLLCNSSSTISKDFESLPVTASTSDELERQALDEYQSSNESFYKELERQAEEQYEGSENSLGPPNDELDFGGLGWLYDFLNFCVPGLLCNTIAVYVYL